MRNKNEIKTSDDFRKEISYSETREVDKTKNEINEKNVAQEKWDKVKDEIENTADAESHGIDEGIKDAVIALNAFDINTGQSCEGHLDNGMSAPWVRVEAPNEPNNRFIGQNEAFEKVAEKYDMPVEETKRMFNMDAYWEAFHECEKNGETEEYQKWREESEKLLYITKDILDDFYKNRQVPNNVKIKVDAEGLEDMAEGSFEIFNGGEDYRNINGEELSDEEKESLGIRLNGYRKEMLAFAEFIKEKFFSEGESYVNEKRSRAQEKIDQEKIEKIQEHIENNL